MLLLFDFDTNKYYVLDVLCCCHSKTDHHPSNDRGSLISDQKNVVVISLVVVTAALVISFGPVFSSLLSTGNKNPCFPMVVGYLLVLFVVPR